MIYIQVCSEGGTSQEQRRRERRGGKTERRSREEFKKEMEMETNREKCSKGKNKINK